MCEVASRRTFLRWTVILTAAGFSGIGLATALLLQPTKSSASNSPQDSLSTVAETDRSVPTDASTQIVTEIAIQQTTVAVPHIGSPTTTGFQSASINVTVLFVDMAPSIIQPTSNTVTVQYPARFSDLEVVLWRTYPVLQTMPAMQVLINGVSLDGDPDLNDGDEVVFIPLMAGG